ncbi:MAG: hypothetical protein HQL89_17990 [Magnetococcales bacterium]|nr:hypothetical protein [Magnetococcales bacterium]
MTFPLNPSKQLANIILDRLIQEGLLRPEKRDQIFGKIIDGTLKEDDWSLEIELAVKQSEKK